MLIPGLAGGGQRPTGLAFATLWLTIVVAAALDNYPTPLVGYGGSAIVGYLLSLSLMSRALRAERREAESRPSSAGERDGGSLSVGLI